MSDKASAYGRLHRELASLLAGERDWLANMANFASAVYHALPDLNWAGFYLARGSDLVLGPFHGKPACVRIALSRGVCGAAASARKTIIVSDVHQFPDHIACDEASRSEIVVPLLVGSRLVGVLDLDSPLLARFDDADRQGLERAAAILLGACDWPLVEGP